MSEYQYYEFAAIDRPLTRTEMAALRAVSTRAVITPTSFTNHYEWGNLKADPAEWMQRYFDAFVYTANWSSRWLSLRVPLNIFPKGALKPFAARHSLLYRATKTHWVIDWALDDGEDDGFAEDDGSSWMRRLVPLRDELLRGDLRPLYLGWMASADALHDDALEPEVPPGLAELSPAQQALAEFLEVDPDLLEAAGTGSATATPAKSDEAPRIAAWLETWQASDMKDVLERIALGRGHEAERRVKAHYSDWLRAQRPSSSVASPRRRVAELRKLALSADAVRREREAKERAKREAARQRQREAELRRLMIDPDKHWKNAHTHAARGVASGYDRAALTIAELAEGYALVSSRKVFDRELQRFLALHGKRAALLRRLVDAGLWSG